jgi:chromosome segregation ATPase
MKGLFIDFIECPTSLWACLDLVSKGNLFAIVVDDLETAKAVLEINKEIKGGVINIFPLSLTENEN